MLEIRIQESNEPENVKHEALMKQRSLKEKETQKIRERSRRERIERDNKWRRRRDRITRDKQRRYEEK